MSFPRQTEHDWRSTSHRARTAVSTSRRFAWSSMPLVACGRRTSMIMRSMSSSRSTAPGARTDEACCCNAPSARRTVVSNESVATEGCRDTDDVAPEAPRTSRPTPWPPCATPSRRPSAHPTRSRRRSGWGSTPKPARNDSATCSSKQASASFDAPPRPSQPHSRGKALTFTCTEDPVPSVVARVAPRGGPVVHLGASAPHKVGASGCVLYGRRKVRNGDA